MLAIDKEALQELAHQPYARTVKREYIKQGYEHQLSLYGVITDKRTGESQYRRIEVLSNTPYTQELIYVLHDFFHNAITPYRYSIWLYDKNLAALKQIHKDW